MLASVWQATPNPLDVDNSGLVSPVDAVNIVNELNTNGARELGDTLPEGFTGPFCDTNGDGFLSAVDLLQVINAINQYPNAPTLSVALSEASDLNRNEVVLSADVDFEVRTTPNSKLLVEFLDGETVLTAQEHIIGPEGEQALAITLPSHVNYIRFKATDVRGRSVSTDRLIRHGDAITEWNAALLEMVRESTSVLTSGELLKPPPPLVSRYLAMAHGAMFDAVNSITKTHVGYAYTEDSDGNASTIAAAASAAYRVALEVYPTAHQKVLWDKTLEEILATVPDGDAKIAGIGIGDAAAAAMIALRENDGWDAASDYAPTDEVGRWRPTPPEFLAPTLPAWMNVIPFAMASGSQFRPAAPPALTSAEYAASVDEVLRLGAVDSTQRTADQTEIAEFWEDGGGTATPPGHWNLIAADVGLSLGLTLTENARLFALLNYALADAGIASWDAKYAFDLWRPIDAIRQAAADGNASTTEDTDWTPLLTTPSFPTYTSGHSTFSGAAASVLTNLIGDSVIFSTWADPGSTGLWPPSDDVAMLARRSFESFDAAASEAGMSRIYGGIHFDFDNTAGLESGSSVGSLVSQNLLAPRAIP